MPEPLATARLFSDRLSTVKEITTLLEDFDAAYVAIYELQENSAGVRSLHYQRRILFELGYFPLRRGLLSDNERRYSVPPNFQLVLNKVSITSPGFWEFLGAINPLQQLRDYLNDRHERTKDSAYRSSTEHERLKLENELLRNQVESGRTSLIGQRATLLRELGYSDEEIRLILWEHAGLPLARLGQYQDRGLIGRIEDVSQVNDTGQ